MIVWLVWLNSMLVEIYTNDGAALARARRMMANDYKDENWERVGSEDRWTCARFARLEVEKWTISQEEGNA